MFPSRAPCSQHGCEIKSIFKHILLPFHYRCPTIVGMLHFYSLAQSHRHRGRHFCQFAAQSAPPTTKLAPGSSQQKCNYDIITPIIPHPPTFLKGKLLHTHDRSWPAGDSVDWAAVTQAESSTELALQEDSMAKSSLQRNVD